MNPSSALELHSQTIQRLANLHRTTNPRVFSSTAIDRATERSDLDLLVDALPGATLLDLGALQVELEALLGVKVDLLTPGDLPPAFRDQVLAEARPI
ncbi:MAG: nucleotidyltransferase [Xanthomonadaceae bacterium]|nr:nucleotidyltransferase [Xanthomonadaceae bacterium]